MYNNLGISEEVVDLVNKCEIDCFEEFAKIDEACSFNSLKVLASFHRNKVSEAHFVGTTGYGYNDLGRDVIEDIFKDVLGCEDALVRGQFISGSHALTVCFFGLLRPGDLLLSISGKPYDTLDEVIGIRDNPSSLKSFGVKYEQIDLVDDDFDYEKIEEFVKNNKVKVVEIQRSKGYSTRKSLSLEKLGKVIKLIKNIDKDVIVMVDNCYCEFVSEAEPVSVGADIIVGSLIKNLGGGIAPNGAYIAGRRDLVSLCADRLTVPGCGKEVGPSLDINKQILQGLFMAPSVVSSALKTAILTSRVMEELGYDVEPKYNDERVDIVQNIIFRDPDKLIEFTRGIQEASAIDSMAIVEPSDMPGYDSQVIMASGSFTQGSSIELSCDGPLREPYIAYMQGGLTYQYGKLGLMKAVTRVLKK
ncbi:MAG: methionine gamma-lyase family protein [Tenericutes bacterium]|nr:methionine gamma-lyase family protein [Mycoplasmatota bacterium]MDD6942291.1 methionine gamma-lyase family protein [bacterium]MDY2696604.1 methionine gamma-lyase family protein [Bacilli bacterium]